MHEKNSRLAVICFAGLDPSGGAGLQADIEAIASCGAHALPIATCLTVQNTTAATAVHAIDSEIIEQQFNCLAEDIHFSACKIGVIPNKEIATCITNLIKQFPNMPVIYDPVIAASHGSEFTNSKTLDSIKTNLLPHVTVMTPNTQEARQLLNNDIDEISQAYKLLEYGTKYVLVTGADETTEHVNNTLLSEQGVIKNYQFQRLPFQYHGSGCTLSSALASLLAQSIPLQQAVQQAQDFTYSALENAQAIGKGQLLPKRI